MISIHFLWLIGIIFLSVILGFVLCSICVAGKRADEVDYRDMPI